MFRTLVSLLLLVSAACSDPVPSYDVYDPEHSIARNWNEALLAAIRKDLARPTVHARNLFHSSALMYDLWAAYDDVAEPYFLGHTVAGYRCDFTAADERILRANTSDITAARKKAISYGMYRLLSHRFRRSPGAGVSGARFDALMSDLGYDVTFTSRDLSKSDPAALGLYLADCIIAFGEQDGSNEQNGYTNDYYVPVNPALRPDNAGTPGMDDPNRWQPLQFKNFIDQAGNELENKPAFIGAEWGAVVPFALQEADYSDFDRGDGFTYRVCHDPGPPALLEGPGAMPEEYQWNHSLVAIWSSHLDPTDGVMWDISPNRLGNNPALPTDIPGLRVMYNDDGTGLDNGRTMNPRTGAPYAINMVPRGDYTRVLAEFWADGPDSETPPGHWFTILNELVHDHPDFERRYFGEGPVLDDLEWDVKAYFVLGGGVHDAAVTAWGIKGWYDYVRPISAIRYMASLGQSSDPGGASYDPQGLPLIDGRIELVTEGDPLAGAGNEHVGKIKLYAWRGPTAIADTRVDTAGVGWILADNWWPYQRPTFVTPPFAGYISGHSTFSRTAAQILSAITGDPYFPGGLGEYVAKKNEFLVFEEGPSVDVTLQWATYQDASDQTSLSRIWGGIHPPVDDVPGRRLGIRIAADAVALADRHFRGR